MAIAKAETPKINDKREIFGWAMYDWANSAFSTTIGTVFLGPYVASLAAKAAELSSDHMAHFLGIPIAADFSSLTVFRYLFSGRSFYFRSWEPSRIIHTGASN